MALSELIDALRAALAGDEWIELILGKYRGPERDARRIRIRPVRLRDETRLAFVTRQADRDLTAHRSVSEGLVEIESLLSGVYYSAHLHTRSADLQLEISRKGKPRLVRSAPTRTESGDRAHDRARRRPIDPARPYLRALGITDAAGRVYPSMQAKWGQINHFVEIVTGLLRAAPLDPRAPIRVVDFGCGKGYLTFAVHELLTHTLNRTAEVRGVEIRPERVEFCRTAAAAVTAPGLTFTCGDVSHPGSEPADLLIALHACDTATDEAIALGLKWNAALILCAPCCHKEVRPQLTAPAPLRPLLKHGIHAADEAEMITDTLRALVLESRGYAARIFEFVGLEHTARNKMIAAVRRKDGRPAPEAAGQIAQLMSFYGIRTQWLVEHVMKEAPVGGADKER